MQLKIKLLLSLLLTSSLYAANPTKSIIAIEYGTGSIAQTYGSSATQDDRDVTKYGIKVGAVEDIKRLFISYRYDKITNPTKETTGYSFSIEYDGMATEGGSGLFMGLILGYGSYDFMGQDATVRTQSDFFYGLDGGVTVNFLENYGFDIGVRYTLPLTETNNDSIPSQAYKIAETTTTYFAINYLY
jgi:hypothetical protein